MASDAFHPAMFARPTDDGAVVCTLCPHQCRLREGGWGICGVRAVRDGVLQTTVYGKAVALNVDPIEKKPLFHFHPGTLAFSIATHGCNLRCSFCQNWSISQVRRSTSQRPSVSPEEVVRAAEESGARSIAFTYTEPTVFFEYAYDTARLARPRGIETVFVTNGYMSAEALATMAPFLGAANVDLKCFRNETYRRVMGGTLQPVLDTLVAMRKAGVWVEVTTLVVPQLNDSPEELSDIAEFIAKELGPDVPWHVSRFHPDHEMTDRRPTPVPTVQKARELGLAAGLRYVYTGNVAGDDGESTYCPECRARVVHRRGYHVREVRLRDGRCLQCGTAIAGVRLDG